MFDMTATNTGNEMGGGSRDAGSAHLPPSFSEEPESKRMKQEWLSFRGVKHTRVGAEFQVSALPTPSENNPRSVGEEEVENPQQENGDIPAVSTTTAVSEDEEADDESPQDNDNKS